MSLPKKPKHDDFRYPASYPREHSGDRDERGYDRAMIHYYKQLAEFAVGALNEISTLTNSAVNCPRVACEALEAIRQTEQLT